MAKARVIPAVVPCEKFYVFHMMSNTVIMYSFLSNTDCVVLCHGPVCQLCVSKEDELKESFKGKDMTYEQYEQLKKLSESHGQGPKEDDTDTKDSPDAARRRYCIPIYTTRLIRACVKCSQRKLHKKHCHHLGVHDLCYFLSSHFLFG